MTHTPGPWRVSGCQLGSKLLIEHGNEETVSPIIGAVYTDGGRLPQQANAALISAAPAMHEALKRLCEKIARVNNIQHSGGRIIAEDWAELYQLTNEGKAALVQAEGKE